tara:strand:- start:329 stop:529 length:201 start_codon:yes stop_codon:yes gene_type:complete
MRKINKSFFSSKKRESQRNKKNERNLLAKLREVTVMVAGIGTKPRIFAVMVISETWPPLSAFVAAT